MATLIAANYQSTTVTGYGGMSKSCGKLKPNTLYTLKCRYKYTKNTSSFPQILCYNSNWSYGGSIYDGTDDGIMKTRIVTFTSYPSEIDYNIACYAWSYNDQNNGGGKTGVLEVDWYELWEGDAREFSLADAIALSENKSATDFLNIGGTTDTTSSYYNKCTNHAYFSSVEPQNAVRSWMGYYYNSGAKLQSASLSATSVGAGANTITVSYNIKNEWTNGKKTGASGVKPTVTSTLGTVGTIGATDASGNGSVTLTIGSRGTNVGNALSGTVTVSYGDDTKTLTFSQNGNYVTAISVSGATLSYSNIGPAATSASATTADGTVTYTFSSGSTSTTKPSTTYGSLSITNSYSIANTTTGGFTAINSSTGALTATSRGTTIGNARKSATVTRTATYTWTPTASYNAAGTKTTTAQPTATCTQNGNYVTNIEANSNSFSYSNIGAGATSASPTTSHAPKYTFSTGKTSTTTPSSDYGSLSTSVSYSIANTTTGGFTAINSSTGVLTATGRGTTVGAARTSATVTKTLKYTWTPTTSYNAAGTKTTGDLTKTATCTQEANYMTALAIRTWNASNFTSAGGGTIDATVDVTYSSGSSHEKWDMLTISNWSCSSTGFSIAAQPSYSGQCRVTSANRGTTTGEARKCSLTVTYKGATNTNNVSLTDTKEIGTQAANAITSYENPTFDMWYSTGLVGNSATPVEASGGTSDAPTYTVSQKANYTSGSQGSITPSVTSAVFSDASSSSTTIKSTYTINASTGKVTFGSLGTTSSTSATVLYVKLTIVSHGKTGTYNGGCWQAANTITSYGTPQMKGVKWSTLVPAGGGTATPSVASYNQVATWSSGSKSNITTGAEITFARAQVVQNTDPEFYNGTNSIALYDNASSGKTTLTRITSGYPSGIPNNSGVAYKLQNTGAGPNPNLGGFRHGYAGTSGQTYIWTFDAYVPTGYTLQHNHNTLGSGGSYSWRTPSAGAGEWRTYSIEVYFGTSNSSAFYCSLVGTAGSSSKPVVWYIANSKICKISNVSATAPTINTTTGAVTLASRGTTTGATGVVDTYGAVVGTITMNGKTGKFVAAPSQQANAVTKIEAAVANTDTSSCHWYVSPGTSSNKIAAAGGTGTVVGNGTCVFTFTSGSTERKGSNGDYKGNELSFSRTYKISGTTATTSNGFTLDKSTGAVTAGNNASTSDRKVNITSDLTVSWDTLSHTLSQSRDVYQSKGTVEYIITPSVTSTGALAAAGATKTSTITYTTKWNGVTTATGTTLSGYTIEETADKLGIVSASGTTGTVTITSSNNKSTTGGSTNGAFTYTIKKSGYTQATISGYVSAGSKIYGDPSVTFSYATFAAGGATKTPTLSYSQTWTWNGVSGSGGTVTSGATNIVYGMTAKTGFTLNSTSTGSITAANNTSTSERSTTASVSFTLNGKNASKTATVKQSGGTRYFRVKSITATQKALNHVYDGYESIYITMQTTVSGSTPTTSSTWSDITGNDVTTYTNQGVVPGVYLRVNQAGSYNASQFLDLGNVALLNGTGTYTPSSTSSAVTRPAMIAEAKWRVEFTWSNSSVNTATTNTVLAFWSDTNNYGYTGEGKSYITFTRAAKPSELPIQIWGRNENNTDVYGSFQTGWMRVMYCNDGVGYSAMDQQMSETIAWGGGVSGYDSQYDRRQLSNITYSVPKSSSGYNYIQQIQVDFGYASVENTLDSSRYRACDLWVEISKDGNLNDTNYGGSFYSTWDQHVVISTNSNPLNGSGGMGVCTFTFYEPVQITENTVIGIFFRFYNY